MARAARRRRLRASSGASVATTMMTEPSARSATGGASSFVVRRARGLRSNAPRRPLFRSLAARRGREVFLQIILAEFAAHGRAVHREDAAEVGLHEHADGVAAAAARQDARGGADAALEAEGDGARARADRALFDRAALRGTQRAEDLFAPDVAAPDVVEEAVVRLADERVDGAHLLVAGQGEHPLDERVRRARDVERVGEQNRRLDLAEFLEPASSRRACRSRCRRRRRRAPSPERGCPRAARWPSRRCAPRRLSSRSRARRARPVRP